MRLPTSVVVMGLLTSIPFGLAIRDTVREPSDPVAKLLGEDEPQVEASDHDEAHANEIREEAATREARRLAQSEILHHLYRNDPATPFLWGSTNFSHHGISVHYDGSMTHIEITDELMCGELDRELVVEWGPGAPNDGRVWLDPPGFAGQRARLFDGGCKLDYDRYTPAEVLLTTGPESIVPLAAIGTDAKSFRARLDKVDSYVRLLQDGGAALDGDFVSWTAPGLGAGTGRIELKASLKHGKITQLFASGTSDDATLDELESSLDASFGPSSLDGEDDRLRRWGGKSPIALLRSAVGYTLFVGHPDRAR